jgi:hypothetical protein
MGKKCLYIINGPKINPVPQLLHFIDMITIIPQKPSQLSPYVRACLEGVVRENLAGRISIGGGFGLFHYIDYRVTHDVDACRLLTSPAYHLLRRWHGLSSLSFLGQQIASVRDDPCLVQV